jgi:beta-glucosidase-like glycosyl hydrolase
MAPFNTYPYCNEGISSAARTIDLVSRLTAAEKAALSVAPEGANSGAARLAVPPLAYGEALHGVDSRPPNCSFDVKDPAKTTSCATSFAHHMLTSASFNRTLWAHTAAVIATEARALQNVGQWRPNGPFGGGYGAVAFAPNINLGRDPRWGRIQEVPGEDPFLTGEFALQYVPSLQAGSPDGYGPSGLRPKMWVPATIKHFADYDVEGGPVNPTRKDFNASVSQLDQDTYFLPAFEAAVRGTQAAALMCSYNGLTEAGVLNYTAVPSCGDSYLLRQKARIEWGFKGFVVSDCGAISDDVFTNFTTALGLNASQHAAWAIRAGTSANCGGFFESYLLQAVLAGDLEESELDTSIALVLEQWFDAGFLDETKPGQGLGYEVVDTPSSRQLALDGAVQSIVLLENQPPKAAPLGAATPTLPLDPTVATGSIALVGPHLNATLAMQSNYHGVSELIAYNTPLLGISRRYAGKVTSATGCADANCNSTAGFAEAVSAASDADVTVIFAGLDPNARGMPSGESEGWDRGNITFPGNQLQLIQQVSAAARAKGKAVVLVLIHGGSMALDTAQPYVDAIVDAFYPGQAGGEAIAKVLFGDASPSGRLTATVYPASLMQRRPDIHDMDLRNNGGLTYLWTSVPVVYPFGHGLSYTNFSFTPASSSPLRLSAEAVAEAVRDGDWYRAAASGRRRPRFASPLALTDFVVNVTNTGSVASDVSVLAFSQPTVDVLGAERVGDSPYLHIRGTPQPIKKLVGFDRVAALAPGQTVTVSIPTAPHILATVITDEPDWSARRVIVPGTYELRAGDDVHGWAVARLVIEGDDIVNV